MPGQHLRQNGQYWTRPRKQSQRGAFQPFIASFFHSETFSDRKQIFSACRLPSTAFSNCKQIFFCLQASLDLCSPAVSRFFLLTGFPRPLSSAVSRFFLLTDFPRPISSAVSRFFLLRLSRPTKCKNAAPQMRHQASACIRGTALRRFAITKLCCCRAAIPSGSSVPPASRFLP